MSSNNPLTLVIQEVDCVPQTIVVSLGGGRDPQTVTLVTVFAGSDEWLGQEGIIKINENNGDYHFALASDPSTTYILPKCSVLFNECTTSLVNFVFGEYGSDNPPGVEPYNLDFSIGTQTLVFNGLTPFDPLPIVPSTSWVLPTDNSVDECNNIIIPCIPQGQRVLTPSGYQLVETLKNGDLVMTPDGRSVEIKMSSFLVPLVTEKTAPIFIPANTFGENSPVNDIALSPDHMIMIKPGVWDAPRHLYNYFNTITLTNLGEHIFYYNIITPNYLTDNIVVEGSTVEAYGKAFTKQYPGQRQYYNYSEEQGGYIRITMQDVLSETKNLTSCRY